MPRTIPSETELRTWTTTLSNWGRWGEDDQFGTLNFITPEKRRQALKEGDALPGDPPKFPIKDQEDMNNANGLKGNSSIPNAVIERHMRKQAKKHGLTLPKSLQASSSS